MDSRIVQAEIAAVSLHLKDFELLKQAAERDLLKDEVDQRAALVRKKCLERAWDRWRERQKYAPDLTTGPAMAVAAAALLIPRR